MLGLEKSMTSGTNGGRGAFFESHHKLVEDKLSIVRRDIVRTESFISARQGEIARLESELAAARAMPMEPLLLPGQAAGVDSLMAELHSAQARIEQLTNDVDDARAELQAKLEKTKQFLSMRTLLTKKNMVIKQLRDQLGAHGIASVDDIGATD